MWNDSQGELDYRPAVITRPLVSRRLSRREWLGELEPATMAWRENRAREYLRAGERSWPWETRCDLLEFDERAMVFAALIDRRASSPVPSDYWSAPPSRDPLPVPQWHASRAEAQRDRWSRLGECGSQQIVTRCECGDHQPRTTVMRCDHWRLCVECRGRRKARYQARFETGRQRALKRLRHLTDKRRFRREGRWSEKMLTLTIPHGATPADDIRELRRALPAFRASVARYLKRKGSVAWKSVPYWRSLEATASDGGHAHYHLWLLCPYLPQELVAHWWGRALSKEYQERLPLLVVNLEEVEQRDQREYRTALRGRSALFAPVVDLRAANTEARGELVKYLVKDCVGDPRDGQHIEPHVYAAIYAALEGARALATSTHWLDAVERNHACECCGALLSKRFELVPLVENSSVPPPA